MRGLTILERPVAGAAITDQHANGVGDDVGQRRVTVEPRVLEDIEAVGEDVEDHECDQRRHPADGEEAQCLVEETPAAWIHGRQG